MWRFLEYIDRSLIAMEMIDSKCSNVCKTHCVVHTLKGILDKWREFVKIDQVIGVPAAN